MKRTNRTLFIHNTARGRIKFLLLALFAFQGLQAQKLFPAPSAIETHKGTFSYDEVSAKCVRTTISKSLPAIGIEYSDEAYQLEITPDSIFIDATSVKGAFYARQAIKQLAQHERGKSAVAGFTVRHATHGADLCSMKAATSSAKRKLNNTST